MLNAAAIADLREKIRGPLLTQDAPDYDATRKVFNGMVNKRPALIARCTNASDVAACVNFACDHGVLLSVRGGGHNFAGKAVCEGGLMLDFTLRRASLSTRGMGLRAPRPDSIWANSIVRPRNSRLPRPSESRPPPGSPGSLLAAATAISPGSTDSPATISGGPRS
jgi:FAD binding domain